MRKEKNSFTAWPKFYFCTIVLCAVAMRCLSAIDKSESKLSKTMTEETLQLFIQGRDSDGCNSGCIKCDKLTRKCLICDNFNLYSLTNGFCFKTEIENCLVSKQFGVCAVCYKGFYYDQSQLKCERISQAMSGCEFYESESRCRQCSQGYQVDPQSGTCRLIHFQIKHCLFYDLENPRKLPQIYLSSSSESLTNPNEVSVSEGHANDFYHCLQCASEYYLNLSGAQCDAISKNACLSIHNTKCISFQTNYAYKYSYVNYEHLSMEAGWMNVFMDWVYSPLLNLESSKNYLNKLNLFDRTKKTFNCSRLIDLESCSQCHPEFSLNLFNLQCEYAPIRNVYYCLHFDSINEVCVDCQPGYQLYNGLCVSQISISYCQNYDTKIMQCSTCADGFYFSNAVKRCIEVPVITYCTEFNLEYTKCIKCESNFKVEESTNKCTFDFETSNPPENCQILDSYSGQCKKCQTGFILSTTESNKCLVSETAVENCREFKTNDDSICEKCRDGFEGNLEKSKCSEKKDPIYNCEEIQEDGEICLKCSKGFKISDNKKKCEFSTELVEFCKEVSISEEKCVACLEGYNLSDNGLVCEYGVPPNCKDVEEDQLLGKSKCSKCEDGYQLDKASDKCYTEIQFCEEFEFKDSVLECVKCHSGYEYHTFTKICFEKIPYCKEPTIQRISEDKGVSGKSTRVQKSFFDNLFYQYHCCQCIEKYKKNSHGTECLKEIDNCDQNRLLEEEGKPGEILCDECEEGFVKLNSGKHCEPEILNCVAHYMVNQITTNAQGVEIQESKVKCSTCLQGFTPNLEENKCYFIINGCEKYNFLHQAQLIGGIEFLICSKCHEDLSLSQNSLNCLVPIPFCLEQQFVDRTGQLITQDVHCSVCKEGYRLSQKSKECSLVIEHCSEYKLETEVYLGFYSQCSVCLDSFILSTDNTKCLAEIPHCEITQSQTHFFSNSLHCLKCESDYELSEDLSKCLSLIPFCEDYESSTNVSRNCSRCREPFSLNEAKTDCVLQKCSVFSESSCVKCKFGFKLVEGDCLSYIPFCAAYLPTQSMSDVDPNKLICVQCEMGLSLSYQSTRCITEPEFCSEFQRNADTNNWECSKCHSGHILQNKKCEIPILNCLEMAQSDSKCLQCKQNFVLNDSALLCQPLLCETFNQEGNCSQCENTNGKFLYKLNDANYCEQKNPSCLSFANTEGEESAVCQECKTGYTDETCSTHPVRNCEEYESATICKACLKGFYVSNNRCYISDCSYKASYNCYSCSAGFKMSADKTSCDSELPNCKVINATNISVCDECQPGFMKPESTAGSNNCISSIPNCSTFTVDSASCLKCDSGYHYNSELKICVTIIPNCAEADSKGESCVKCAGDYSLANQCFAMDTEACIEKRFGLFCLKCAVGYVYNGLNYTCIPTVYNCGSYSSDSECSLCKSGLVTDSTGRCVSPSCSKVEYKPYCETCKAENTITKFEEQYCTECSPGYVINSNNICLSSSCNNHSLKLFSKTFQCTNCSEEGKLDNHNGQCLTTTSVCDQYNLEKQCTSCVGFLLLFSGICFDSGNQLENCLIEQQEYDIDREMDLIKCYKPSIGRYFEDPSVKVIDFIPNCMTYSNTDYCNKNCDCSECKVGFELFKDNLGRSRCYDQSKNIMVNNHSSDVSPLYSSVEFRAPVVKSASHRILSIITENEVKCAWDYFTNAKQICEERSIIDDSCILYHKTKDACEKCKDGFFTTTTSRCGKMPDYQTENCVKYSSGQKDKLGKLQISEFNHLSVFSLKMGDKLFSQRVVYDMHVSLIDSHFCIVCDKDFYLTESNFCKPVLNQEDLIADCFSYDKNLDCLRCSASFYLSSFTKDDQRKTSCESSPHLENCLISHSKMSCLKCKSGYEPQLVQQSNQSLLKCINIQVDNCESFHIYEGREICVQCKEGFWPEEEYLPMSSIIQSQNVQELVWEDSKDNTNEDSPYSEIQFSDNHSRGLKFNQPFLNTYINNYYKYTFRNIKECKKVNSAIPNCQEYFSSLKCKFCLEGFILSSDSTSCISKIDKELDERATSAKCLKLQENKNGCNICMPGYYFNTQVDECQQCGIENCLLCREDSYNECQVCKSGFYMDYTGKCLLNTFVIEDKGFGDQFAQEVQEVKGVFVISNFDTNGNILCSESKISPLMALVLLLTFTFKIIK